MRPKVRRYCVICKKNRRHNRNGECIFCKHKPGQNDARPEEKIKEVN